MGEGEVGEGRVADSDANAWLMSEETKMERAAAGGGGTPQPTRMCSERLT